MVIGDVFINLGEILSSVISVFEVYASEINPELF